MNIVITFGNKPECSQRLRFRLGRHGHERGNEVAELERFRGLTFNGVIVKGTQGGEEMLSLAGTDCRNGNLFVSISYPGDTHSIFGTMISRGRNLKQVIVRA